MLVFIIQHVSDCVDATVSQQVYESEQLFYILNKKKKSQLKLIK